MIVISFTYIIFNLRPVNLQSLGPCQTSIELHASWKHHSSEARYLLEVFKYFPSDAPSVNTHQHTSPPLPCVQHSFPGTGQLIILRFPKWLATVFYVIIIGSIPNTSKIYRT